MTTTSSRRALVTRPRAEAEALAAALLTRGVIPVIEPLIDIVERGVAAPSLDDVQALLCTSANGAQALARATPRRDLRVFAVGDRTAAQARTEGFAEVESAGGTVEDLAALVRRRLDPRAGRLLHAAGSAVAGDFGAMLSSAGFAVERAVLYEARPAAALTPATAALIGRGLIDLALFFSPRTAAIFARLAVAAGIGDGLRATRALSISAATDAGLAGLPFRGRRIALQPTQAALLELVEQPRCGRAA